MSNKKKSKEVPFAEGDMVVVKDTITPERYNQPGGPGWVNEMHRCIGGIGQVTELMESYEWTAQVQFDDCDYVFFLSDLEEPNVTHDNGKVSLQVGDACRDMTDSQRDYAIRRIKELGLGPDYAMYDGPFGSLVCIEDFVVTHAGRESANWREAKKYLEFYEFMQRLEVTKRKHHVPPITTAEGLTYNVVISDDLQSVTVGCTELSREDVKKLKDRISLMAVCRSSLPVLCNDMKFQVEFDGTHTVSYADIRRVAEKMGL